MALPHALTGGAWLTFAGRRWWLRITYRVLLACEEAAGVDMLAASIDVSRPSARVMQALLWAALRADGGEWSLREVGSRLTLANMFAVHQALLEAWTASMPEPRPKAEQDEPVRRGVWIKVWAAARQELGLSDDEWLDMTPRQVQALRDVRFERDQREELLVGIVAAAVANFGFRSPGCAMRPESFMVHKFAEKAAGPLTGEMIMAALRPVREKFRKAS